MSDKSNGNKVVFFLYIYPAVVVLHILSHKTGLTVNTERGN